VGKSTLLNRLLGQKIAITSPKPQTTRDQILGIVTHDDAQILFLDTPGIHRPLHKLGEHMVAVATATLRDADLALWLVDGATPPTDEDRAIGELLRTLYRRQPLPPLVLGINKVDAAGLTLETLAERTQEYLALVEWLAGAAVPPAPAALSALTGAGVDELVAALRARLPRGPRYFPADEVTDIETRFIVAELIREKALNQLQQEVPHSIAVVVDEFIPRGEEMTYISAVIYVERASQKGIVLGEKGSRIKQIGRAARPEIEELVGTRVYLELWVKVWEKWRTREAMLRRLGYALRAG
jgi:GTP-binding protein Era